MIGELDPIKFTLHPRSIPSADPIPVLAFQKLHAGAVNSVYLPIGTDLHYSSGIAAMLKRAILLLTQIKWICVRLCRTIGQGSMRNNFAD